MKTGRSLQELAIEVDRQAKATVDFKSDTRRLRMVGEEMAVLPDRGQYRMSDLAHQQVAARVEIPQKYYDLMRAKAPGLLDTNVNHWFETKPETRLVRTLDSRVRAFLSSSYRPLDNFRLIETVLPRLQKLNATIESAEITEKHLYLKAVFGHIQGNVAVGDVVKMGLVVSNSEVGCGSLKVEPMIYRLVCKNGMIVADSGIRKYHVGRRNDEDGIQDFLRQSTKQADDRAFWMKVRDVIDATVTKEAFDKMVEDMKRAKDQKIEVPAVEAVELIASRYRMSEGEQGSVLEHLIRGCDMSTYGMVNAVTRASQDMKEYERATEFERWGGEILAASLN